LQEGIDRQREDGEAIAFERDWEVVATFADNDTSASDTARDRPGFQALMSDFQAGKLDAVIVYDVDRMYWRVREAQLLVNQVEDWGLRRFVIASATDDYNLANPDERDDFMGNVRSAEIQPPDIPQTRTEEPC
jgi:DNA invertase Pin-like site-specific DNA recombinase